MSNKNEYRFSDDKETEKIEKSTEALEKEIVGLKKEVHRIKAVATMLVILLFNLGIFINNKFSYWAVIGILVFELLALLVYAKGSDYYNYLVDFFRKLVTKQDKKKP